jgi:pyridoxamine 5'-phosphate oxidase family protein
MSTFTEKEIEYLRGQLLGRLATVGRDGSPHVVPVGFRLGPEDEAIEIGSGGDMRGSKKWRDLKANPRVAFVVDDLERVDPWTPRGLLVRGRAELHEEGGESFGEGWGSAWIRILPRRIVSWGIEGHAFSDAGRRSARSVGGGG